MTRATLLELTTSAFHHCAISLIQGQQVMASRSRHYVLLRESLMSLWLLQVVGPAGEIPKAPVQQMKFLEDMDASELAQAVR